MEKDKRKRSYAEEVKTIVIKEKGITFWEEFVKEIEQCQRDNFIDVYKYAIQLLEDGLTAEK